MSNSKAGSMAASMMWAFAIGSGVVGVLLGFYTPGFLGFLLGMGIFVAGGWAAVYMTSATTGKGILGMLVGALAASVVGFVLWKMAASSAMSGAGGQAFNDAMAKAQAQGGAKLTAEQQAQMAQLGNVMAGGAGVIVGITAAFFGMLKTFLFGMVGCFIGGAMKKSAIGTPAAMSKAA
ncbi:MAG: hypothetical protein JWN44_1436 [Myxococcales bacterium]|nr:hypothetical protein [Myxococcales bacterium]